MKLLLIAFLACSCIPAFSQQTQKGRTCRVIFPQRPADAPVEAHLFDGSISHKVQLTGMNFSEVVKLPAGDLVLGLTPNPVLNPEDFPAGAPIVKIPEAITDCYVILGSDPANKILPVRMLPVDVGGDKLKPGQTLWINLTQYHIKGMLGDEPLLVPAGKRVIGKAPLASSGYYKAAFLYQPDAQTAFLPVMKKTWWYDSTSKNLGFIIDSGGRLPRIFTFRDHRADEKLENPE
jgi:hypothetical protein